MQANYTSSEARLKKYLIWLCEFVSSCLMTNLKNCCSQIQFLEVMDSNFLHHHPPLPKLTILVVFYSYVICFLYTKFLLILWKSFPLHINLNSFIRNIVSVYFFLIWWHWLQFLSFLFCVRFKPSITTLA